MELGKCNLALIGLRGTGKSTVAGELAARLEWPWLDADDELQRRDGRRIAEIFSQSGERFFRDLEAEVVADLAGRSRHVLALGGGAVLREANRLALSRRCIVVWLRAAVDELVRRIEDDVRSADLRPSLTELDAAAEMRAVLQQRRPLYEAAADYWVDTGGKSPASVADEILTLAAESLPPGSRADKRP